MASSVISDFSSLIAKYKENEGNLLAQRKIRSEVIHLVGNLYERSKGAESGLNKKLFQNGLSDGFLRTAEEVVKGNAFSSYPGSQMRLTPLAQNCIDEWNTFINAIGQLSTGELEEGALELRTDAFVRAHRLFANQYVEERKVSMKDTHLGVQLTMPVTLSLFYCFAIEFLDLHPELGDQLKTMLEDSDGKVFVIIPHLAILALLKHKDCPCPELLQKFESEIASLREHYERLPNDESKALECHLFDESIPLSNEANQLHLKILEMAYRLNEKEYAQPFANCFRSLIGELNCDFSIVEQLRKDLEHVDLDGKEMDVSDLILALLHLKPESLKLLYPFLTRMKEIESFQARFSSSDESFKTEVKDFLHSCKRIDLDPAFMKIEGLRSDLKREPKLYRLFGIMQLALKK